MRKVQNLLDGKKRTRKERTQQAVLLAHALYEESKRESTWQERKKEAALNQIMRDPQGRAFATLLTDQAFRSRCDVRTADQLVYLLCSRGTPRSLPLRAHLLLLFFRLLGKEYPHFSVQAIKKAVHREVSCVLLPEEVKARTRLFEKGRQEGVEFNINHLGEAILSEEEAKKRLNLYLEDCRDPLITYISIKISTLFSQINLTAWDDTLSALDARLSSLYRAAGEHTFVNLDMEEYRDLDLTCALFKQVLSKEEFRKRYAGIALQAYLPDAFEKLQELIAWVRRRGHPIKVRLVKGANLALERVESSLHNWPLAPFSSKEQSDAQYKKMLEYAVEEGEAIDIGVGSHNLFDIAYALLLRKEYGCEARVAFEMLSGMAPSIQRVIGKLTGKVVLYAPEARAERFDYAISYLLRRFDENGSPQNFLHHLYRLKEKNEWEAQAAAFCAASNRIDTLSSTSNRAKSGEKSEQFQNEPDIDFSLPEGRECVQSVWIKKRTSHIPLVIGGEEREGEWGQGIDPSEPETIFYAYAQASKSGVEEALACAQPSSDPPLRKVAELMRKRKKELLNALIADVGKCVLEGNGEISEAIDFLEYYSRCALPTGYAWKGRGTVLIAPPWNFSLSIPTGGIAAALKAGNAVIFKPAPEAVLVGWTLVQLFWEAGVSKKALQFLPCADEPVGSHLIRHRKLDGVVLTGATETAQKFLDIRPDLHLVAETGGKNALIITALCDRDLAIKDAIHSAFAYSGQKCSACSLLILEKELYRDDVFLNQLKEAAKSLPVGSAWNATSTITPLIRPPQGGLKRALTTLEEGEEWLLSPHPDPDNPHLWSPGIKLHVKPESFTHQTEFFGPLLGVMCAETLEEGIAIANGTPYGLTAGIHTLDNREKEVWKERIVAGNLYINRTITGAIVGRQPFGGCKASSFGPGAKAGGPHYVEQLAIAEERELPNEEAPLPPLLIPLLSTFQEQLDKGEQNLFIRSLKSYAYWAQKFKTPQDPSKRVGQENWFYLVPKERVILRIEEGERPIDYLRVIAACALCGTPLEISASTPLFAGVKVEPKAMGKEIRRLNTPVYASGRLELLHYLREVTLSHDTHRYGYLSPDPL